MLRLSTLLAVLLVSSTAHAAETEWFIEYGHVSDITRGHDPTVDVIAGGITIRAGKRRAWEIDLSHGIKSYDCSLSAQCKVQGASMITTRLYPGRLKQ